VIWGYTPRRAAAYLELGANRRRRELGERLSIAALAARGDPAAVQKQIKQLSEPE
jgi:hypothetical protein